jgi:hypothetical protein
MGRMIDLVERIMLKKQQEARMKGLFFIPETKEEISALIEEIIKRNQGSSAALDVMYAVELTKAFYTEQNKEVA